MGRYSIIMWSFLLGILMIISGAAFIINIMAYIILLSKSVGIFNPVTLVIHTLILLVSVLGGILTAKKLREDIIGKKTDTDDYGHCKRKASYIMWTLVIIGSIIGMLSILFLAIFDGDSRPNDICNTSSGFGCTSKPIIDKTAGTVEISISNGLDYDIHIKDVTVERTATLSTCDSLLEICDAGAKIGDPGCSSVNNYFYNWSKYGSATIYITGCNFSNYPIIKGDITLNYVNSQSSLPETLIVSITGKVPRR